MRGGGRRGTPSRDRKICPRQQIAEAAERRDERPARRAGEGEHVEPPGKAADAKKKKPTASRYTRQSHFAHEQSTDDRSRKTWRSTLLPREVQHVIFVSQASGIPNIGGTILLLIE